ncbi:MAG: hypothetical protein JWM49_2040 [Microbacteriaceae bacterium]|nr:hypothetical protein [Microbacteriaceae bacterium]
MHLEPLDQGTFLFPPATYTGIADYVNFWTTVPISDGVLANITAGYAEMIRLQLIAASVTWGHKYDAEHHKELHTGSDEKKIEVRKKRDGAHMVFVEEWHESHPRRIKPNIARSIARAGQLYFFHTSLSDEDSSEEARR